MKKTVEVVVFCKRCQMPFDTPESHRLPDRCPDCREARILETKRARKERVNA